MTEISSNLNLNKSAAPRIVAVPPANLPNGALCKDEDMNKRMRALNKDIYQSSKNENKKDVKTFIKWFGGFVALVIGIRFFRNRF